MSGYVFAMGACITCGRLFSFNPNAVPSTTALTGEREPLCRVCVDAINEKRATLGLPPFAILPDAYEPLPESEL
jgi:hypothetical protein